MPQWNLWKHQRIIILTHLPTQHINVIFVLPTWICTWPKTDEWIERYNYLKNTSRTSTFRVKALRRSMGQENRYYNFPINKGPSLKTTKCCLYFPCIVVSFSFGQINIHHLHLRIGKQPQIKTLFTRNFSACIEYLRCVWLIRLKRMNKCPYQAYEAWDVLTATVHL